MKDVADILGPQGLLASNLEGFAYRSQQEEMAAQVARTLEQGGVLITEAGTGTGKTFAYLVPALISGRKVIISTGTRNLQDQLFHRDLPLVRDAMALPTRIALLKGRANYLCLHRMDNTLSEGRFKAREMVDHLMKIQRWSGKTRTGDIAELSGVPEDAQIWPHVTSTTDNCLGQDCPVYGDCHLAEARRGAQEADLVVINHHLLCADFSLREGGFGELLPATDCFIVDEAHQLPEVASNFFGATVSGRQLTELVRDIKIEYTREAGDLAELPDQADRTAKAVRDMRLLFGLDNKRAPWSEFAADESMNAAMKHLRGSLDKLQGLLGKLQGRGKGLDSCHDRCQLLSAGIGGFCDRPEDGEIRWFETHSQSFRLNRTPLEISSPFREQMGRHEACWVFTSATLAVGGNFSHFQRQLGLDEAETALWDSPFDYPEQALWYVPRGLPEPRSPVYIKEVVEVAVPVLEASKGRAFLLFTSHRALREAAKLLEGEIDFPLLIQGSAPKGELLERFRELGNAVLLGTASFWEGVDVRGSALSCVIIDKLPFASPGDPVLQARIEALRKRGGNPFMEYQVPQAAIALKQGAGRLIRDVTDRGVLMICDPRLLRKGYGHTFLNSLPPMARTRELEQVQHFFSETMPA
ncbi:MAG: ATP-dependent DNA helicase [Gammaproteobacteria bacterium]|nr:ATP-dependent DNA helicase [Gammaproteobacteria bacterium]